ncbi:MAG: hypothetical protein HYV07_15885 [Deltaproteobacteria bacterium]|nr:hypothetical protein [Deltaproteobacteria bacterium]
MEFFQQDIGFGITLMQFIMGAAGLFVAGKVWDYLKAPGRQRLVQKRCSSCTFVGAVEAKNFACPKCKAQLRDLRR